MLGIRCKRNPEKEEEKGKVNVFVHAYVCDQSMERREDAGWHQIPALHFILMLFHTVVFHFTFV